MKTVRWHFDFLSPYSYLQSLDLARIEAQAHVERVPVLLAGLLQHWGTKGPAEVAPKRSFTFQQTSWLAHARGIKLSAPSPFPFNFLPLLRLASVLRADAAAVARIFDWVWREGHQPAEAGAFDALLAELGVARAALDEPAVKQHVRANTDAAIAADVFGVPTSVVDGHRFWGQDSTDMLLAYLAGDSFFDSKRFQMASELAAGVQRKA
jgi:2-hydroxychromene-2-carboxylate isomerase